MIKPPINQYPGAEFTINVVNLKRSHGKGYHLVCRPLPLGNPYLINKVRTRDEAIYAYKLFLERMLDKDNPVNKQFQILMDYVIEHKVITLACYCKPLDCHADVIREEMFKRLNLMFRDQKEQ